VTLASNITCSVLMICDIVSKHVGAVLMFLVQIILD